MNNIYLSIVFGLLFISSFSQEVDLSWANSFGGTSGDHSQSMANDQSGNIYTTGFFNNTVDFDPSPSTYELTSNGNSDIFVQKLDSNGNFIWAIAIGGSSSDEGYGISTDVSGNIFITGGFNLTVDFDHGPGIQNLTSNGSDDIFILKLNSNGDFLWVKSVGGTANDQGRAIVTDTSGNIYLTGYYQGEVDFNPGAGVFTLNYDNGDEAFILKLDANGDFLWANEITDPKFAQGYAIQIDILGNVLVTGTLSAGSVTFIKKLDENGNTLWYKTVNGESTNKGYSIITDTSSNVYVTGVYQLTTDFDPSAGIFNLTSLGYTDIFILKLNSNGDFLWVKSMGENSSDSGEEIIIDNSGYIYVTGTFEGTVDFDPSGNIFNLTSNGGRDLFIQKLDENGNFVWATSIGGTGSEYPRGFLINTSGSLYLTGIFQNTVDFDPTGSIFNLTSNGSLDIFNIELGQTSLGLEESTLISDVIIFPNPFQNVINIKLRNHNEVSVKMFNVNGQLIFNENNINTKNYQFSFDGVKGFYLIEVNFQGKKQHFKLIKQ
ncbi:hypothetical protein GCM10023314_07990 [Algibacter agarivorans]|uniref:Secretion system C-terminal sorting domain-containing protein n=1 Tax=Algibacter agarivorans TaxID=1109741 RepID=A0ABP9GCF0_9FLAO